MTDTAMRSELRSNRPLGLFQTVAWLEAAAAATKGQVRWACENDAAVAPIPILERRIGPFLVAGLPLPKSGTPITAGLRGDESYNSATLAAIGHWFSSGSGLHFLQVTSSTPPGDCGASRVEQIKNLEIDLRQDCSALWQGLSSLPRRMIRKALRSGMRVSRIDSTAHHIRNHRRLGEQIFRLQGERPIYSSAHYDALLRPPLSNYLEAFMVSRSGCPLGYLFSLIDQDRAYYWDVAIDFVGRADGAGHLLMWVWMRWCKRKGVTCLDLIGPPTGGRAGRRAGIGRFKLSFGALPVNYWVVYWYRPGVGLALDASRWFSQLHGGRWMGGMK